MDNLEDFDLIKEWTKDDISRFKIYLEVIGYHRASAPGSDNWHEIVKEMCEEEKDVRKEAAKVLTDLEAYGDSYGVPPISEVVALLVAKLPPERLALDEKEVCWNVLGQLPSGHDHEGPNQCDLDLADKISKSICSKFSPAGVTEDKTTKENYEN